MSIHANTDSATPTMTLQIDKHGFLSNKLRNNFFYKF